MKKLVDVAQVSAVEADLHAHEAIMVKRQLERKSSWTKSQVRLKKSPYKDGMTWDLAEITRAWDREKEKMAATKQKRQVDRGTGT